MRKNGLICILAASALVLCACSKQTAEEAQPQTQETQDTQTASELVEQWMADETDTQPVTAANQSDAEIDEGATPLSSFEYTLLEDGTASIIKFIGKDADVVITSHIGDAPVTTIEQYAFEAAWDVKTVQLPDTLQFIGEFAFMDCGSLTDINIPSKVTELRRGTFAGCGALTEFTIPETVTGTAEELFTGCPLSDLYVENSELSYESWGLEELDPKCIIHAPDGADILTWADENGFPIETM